MQTQRKGIDKNKNMRISKKIKADLIIKNEIILIIEALKKEN